VPSSTGGPGGERVIRHHLVDRIYHWTMAVSVLVLMGTAFFPILNWWKFEWVTIHWIAGVVLTVAVLIHIVRAVFWQDLRSMIVWVDDVRDAWRAFTRFFGSKGPAPRLPGKYPLLQKLYHLAIAFIILGVAITGMLMLAKIDTAWWRRNPYFIENSWWGVDQTWGIVYALHGFFAMASITLVLIHIYFAIRPEKLWITRSMILGWVPREKYRQNHDPERWATPGAEPAAQRRAAE
jgi:formate dehydrogenase subunit gamma